MVGREIRDLGLDCQVENGRVRFNSDRQAAIQIISGLRSADPGSRLLWEHFQPKEHLRAFKVSLLWIGKISP